MKQSQRKAIKQIKALIVFARDSGIYLAKDHEKAVTIIREADEAIYELEQDLKQKKTK